MRRLLVLALLGLTARAEGPRLFQDLHRDLLARADEQLERVSQFAELERNFRTWRRENHAEPAASADSDFVRYFTTRGRNRFQASAARLARFRPMIERVFAEEGVPSDWIWVGLVESGYDPLARSPKNAVGIWQLIPETARRYGLWVGAERDDRTEPVLATRAAARYLRFLYNNFGDWLLALAAYNAGEQRVAGAVERAGVRDFWELSRMGLLPRETQDYVPAVLAAKRIGQASWSPSSLPSGE